METRVLMLFCILCSFSAVLSSRVRRHQSHLQSSLAPGNTSTSDRSTYPQYMLQLYHSFKAADHISSLAVNTITTQSDDSSVHSFDSVLSLTAKGFYHEDNRWKVTFDMSSISNDELVLLAEVQIRLPAFSACKHATLDFYHSGKLSCDSMPCQEKEVFLGSFGTTPSSTKSSWKVFNVTALLTYWLQHRDGMVSQEASGEPDVDLGSGAENEESLSNWAPSRNMGKRQRKIQHPTSNRVMMIIFFQHKMPQEGHVTYSLIQTVENSKYVKMDSVRQNRRHKRNRVQRMRVPDGVAATVAPAAPAAEPVQRPMCRRVDMWVDFEHIGWDEWIVHPKRYNAYRCEGECPVPLDESFSPTNHAYMQSLLRHHHPTRASCPSCVPTHLSPLSMLYYENDDLTLRHHEDMIVEECGCH
ncbi:nodal homolog [Oryzias latipes]|uniref:Southpaw n=1 Tax=Oryzias latipes TaxID=8090 RepID=H2LQ88_ORYLA|nr:nodal homolog [Oryzias latipes]